MDEIDIGWMAPPVRRLFLDAVRLFAEAVRDGAVMHMQDGMIAMKEAEQAHLRLATQPPPPPDPQI
jgi:hypothetical protein